MASAVATAAVAIISDVQDPAIFLSRAAAFGSQDPARFASALLPATVYLTHRVTTPGTRMVLRVLPACAWLACIAAMGLSGTRSAWRALGVAALAWLVMRPSARLVHGFATLAIAVVDVVVLVPGAGDYLPDRAGSATGSGGAGRTGSGRSGSPVFSSSPLAGIGFADFPLAFTQQAIDLSPPPMAADTGVSPSLSRPARRALS